MGFIYSNHIKVNPLYVIILRLQQGHRLPLFKSLNSMSDCEETPEQMQDSLGGKRSESAGAPRNPPGGPGGSCWEKESLLGGSSWPDCSSDPDEHRETG